MHHTGVKWCNMVQRRTRKKEHLPEPEKTRVSVTFPTEYYKRLQQVADKKRVSVAWVVRDAVEKYLRLNKSADS